MCTCMYMYAGVWKTHKHVTHTHVCVLRKQHERVADDLLPTAQLPMGTETYPCYPTPLAPNIQPSTTPPPPLSLTCLRTMSGTSQYIQSSITPPPSTDTECTSSRKKRLSPAICRTLRVAPLPTDPPAFRCRPILTGSACVAFPLVVCACVRVRAFVRAEPACVCVCARERVCARACVCALRAGVRARGGREGEGWQERGGERACAPCARVFNPHSHTCLVLWTCT